MDLATEDHVNEYRNLVKFFETVSLPTKEALCYERPIRYFRSKVNSYT